MRALPGRSRPIECIDSAIAFECIDSEAVSMDRECRSCVIDAECVDCQVFEARSVEVLLDRSLDLLMLVIYMTLGNSPGKVQWY